MKFDMLTSYFVSTVFLLVFTGMIAQIYRFVRPAPGLRTWLFAMIWYLLTPFGAILQSESLFAGVFFINLCAAMHMFYAYRLADVWNNERPKWKVPLLFAVLFIGALVTMAVCGIQFPIRGAFSSFVFGAVYLVVAFRIRLIRPHTSLSHPHEKFSSGAFLRAAFIINAAIWWLRMTLVLVTQSGPSVNYGAPANVLMVIVIPAFTQIISLTLLVYAISAAMNEGRTIRNTFLESGGAQVQRNLLANLNHELNTPLGNAMLASEFLSSGRTDDPSAKEGFETLIHSLRQMYSIAQDRTVFWDPDNQLMQTPRFCQLLERMLRRSVAGSNLGIVFTFNDIMVVPRAHGLLMFCLYAGDFLMHNAGQGASKTLAFRMLCENAESGEFILEISDSSASILLPSCDSYISDASRGHQCLAHIDMWPKVLFLENEARSSLNGSLLISRGRENTNLLTVRFRA